MFTLTKKTDYALIALSFMARRTEFVCTAREIADRFHVPSALLMKVLKNLSHGGLIKSLRGAKGGYQLNRSPDRLTLDEIITAVDGSVRFVKCADERQSRDSVCEIIETCPVSKPVQKVHDRMRSFLQEITLADIAYDADFGDQSVPLTIKGTRVRRETAVSA